MLFPLFVVLFLFLTVCLNSQNILHILNSNALGKTVLRPKTMSMHRSSVGWK